MWVIIFAYVICILHSTCLLLRHASYNPPLQYSNKGERKSLLYFWLGFEVLHEGRAMPYHTTLWLGGAQGCQEGVLLPSTTVSDGERSGMSIKYLVYSVELSNYHRAACFIVGGCSLLGNWIPPIATLLYQVQRQIHNEFQKAFGIYRGGGAPIDRYIGNKVLTDVRQTDRALQQPPRRFLSLVALLYRLSFKTPHHHLSLSLWIFLKSYIGYRA